MSYSLKVLFLKKKKKVLFLTLKIYNRMTLGAFVNNKMSKYGLALRCMEVHSHLRRATSR